MSIVLIEDLASDAALIVRELRKAGLDFAWQRVGTEAGLLEALERPVDAILCDYNLPGFDARRALEISKRRRPDVPCLIVSGTMQEELGVELMKLGADDYLLKDRLGRLGQAVEQALERSAEKRAKRATELRLTAILEDVPVVIFSIQPDGIISLAQGRGLAAFGLRPGDLESGTAQELFRGIPELEAMYAAALCGRSEERIVHLPNTGRDVDIHVRPVLDEDARLSQVIGVAADVTERRRAEQALLENEAKSRFLANMSHELRNPLNSVLGFAQLLGSQDRGGLSEKQSRFVTHIETAGRQLLALINDILDLSKVAAGQLNVNLEPLLVDTVINPCLTQMEPLALDRGVSLDLAGIGGLGAIADRQRLMQILTNLVSNALKFTPAGGSVTVLRESDDRAVRLTVADTGKGIPPDLLEFVFDEFAQIESSQSDPSEGTGLGLPLSRRLAELLGGSIELKSELGRGSAFTVTLARAGSSAIPEAATR